MYDTRDEINKTTVSPMSRNSCRLPLESLNGSDIVGEQVTTTKEQNQKKDSTIRRTVSFDSVVVCEHAITLGENPAVTSGPPLTISWESLTCYMQGVDEYESSRGTRRSKMLLRIPKLERELILQREGFSSEELRVAEEAANVIRNSREQSASERSDLQAMIRELKKERAIKKNVRKGLFGFWRSSSSSSSSKVTLATA